MKTGNKALTDSKFTDLLTCVQRLRTDIEKDCLSLSKMIMLDSFLKAKSFLK